MYCATPRRLQEGAGGAAGRRGVGRRQGMYPAGVLVPAGRLRSAGVRPGDAPAPDGLGDFGRRRLRGKCNSCTEVRGRPAVRRCSPARTLAAVVRVARLWPPERPAAARPRAQVSQRRGEGSPTGASEARRDPRGGRGAQRARAGRGHSVARCAEPHADAGAAPKVLFGCGEIVNVPAGGGAPRWRPEPLSL